jgi:hypothetical protein
MHRSLCHLGYSVKVKQWGLIAKGVEHYTFKHRVIERGGLPLQNSGVWVKATHSEKVIKEACIYTRRLSFWTFNPSKNHGFFVDYRWWLST